MSGMGWAERLLGARSRGILFEILFTAEDDVGRHTRPGSYKRDVHIAFRRYVGSNLQTRFYSWVSPKVADLGRVEVRCAAVTAGTRPTYKSFVRIRRRLYTVWVRFLPWASRSWIFAVFCRSKILVANRR